MKKKKDNNKKIMVITIVILIAVLGLVFFLRRGTIKASINSLEVYIKDSITPQENLIVFKNYEDFSSLFESDELKASDFNRNNYVLVPAMNDSCSPLTIKDYNIKNGIIHVTMEYRASCGVCAPEYSYFLIKVNKSITTLDLDLSYEPDASINNLNCDPMIAYKPMIYLYPKEKIDVTVSLGKPNLLTTTYPKYKDGWKVTAYPNGVLKDENREYYGLYWEGKNHEAKIKEEGFIVKGEDSSRFLEEKLGILGLTEREANEFIIYWLPKLEKNKYNYIYFEQTEEVEKYMPLTITPTPDTMIRVYMNFASLEKPIEVKEQTLNASTRKGFTVVEWGGSIIS